MELLDRLLEEKRRHPGDDVLTVMLEAEEDGERLSSEEIKCLALTLLVAGTETSTHLISSGLVLLLQHPGELAKIRRNPGLIRSATDEILRYDGPVSVAMVREATENTTINGLEVSKGHQMCGLLGAGNRDPDVFPEPDRLWIDRPAPKPHLTFGAGVHVCLGAAVARLEFDIVVHTLLLDRHPELALVPDEPIEYVADFPPLRGVTRAMASVGG
jgi:cytochrome P450